MKKSIKYASLFILPALAMATIVVGSSYWKNSVKDETVNVNRITYTLKFNTNGHGIIPDYTNLQFDSAFELPHLGDGFVGWYVSNSFDGTAYNGYQSGLSVFPSSAINGNVVILYANFN